MAQGEPEPEEFKVYTLGEIVVWGERPVSKEVSIVSELSAEEIEASNSRTVAEALTQVPGIRVTTGRRNEPEISIHGFDQRKALILIDGVPYYEMNNGKLDLNQIPSETIAKIEVVKGAPSVLYGPNAEVGVINIITKEPTAKPSLSMDIRVGEKNLARAALSHGQRRGKLLYWLSYVHNESAAYKLSSGFDPEPGVIVSRPGGTTERILEDGGFRNNSDRATDSFWGKLGIEPNEDSEICATFNVTGTERGLPPSTAENSVFTRRPAFSQFARFSKYDDWGVDLSGRTKVSDRIGAGGKFYYHSHDDDYVSYSDENYTSEIATSSYRDHFLGGTVSGDLEPAAGHMLRSAVHYRADSHEERDDAYLPYARSLSHTGSLGLEYESKIRKDLSLVVGTSLDWFRVKEAERNTTDSGTGDFTGQEDLVVPAGTEQFNPMAGAFWDLTSSTRLFGSVAKKTRFPTLQQLFSSKSGNTELEAERSTNYTIGASRPLLGRSHVEGAFFFHDIENWISRDGPDPDNLYRNYAKIRMYGFELAGDVHPQSEITLTFGYTYNHATDESEGKVTDKVLNVPRHKIDHGITYAPSSLGMKFDLTGSFMGSVYSELPTPQNPENEEIQVDDYYTLDARIVKSVVGRLEVYIAVNNIADADYEPEYGYPGPGRVFWLGLTAKH